MNTALTVWPLDQLTDLLARCEAADRPNDLLDAELWGVGGMPADDLKYTASIDAALAFVEATLPRYRFWVGNWQGTGAVLSPDRNNDQRSDAATPALSIICAALKAIIALRTQPEASGAWPAGCAKRSSCARHRMCVYGHNGSCRHADRDIRAEVEAAA